MPLYLKLITMKKILMGALVCAAVAGVVAYLIDPEKFTDTVDDLKGKASDALGKANEAMTKAKDGFGKMEKNAQASLS